MYCLINASSEGPIDFRLLASEEEAKVCANRLSLLSGQKISYKNVAHDLARMLNCLRQEIKGDNDILDDDERMLFTNMCHTLVFNGV